MLSAFCAEVKKIMLINTLKKPSIYQVRRKTRPSLQGGEDAKMNKRRLLELYLLGQFTCLVQATKFVASSRLMGCRLL